MPSNPYGFTSGVQALVLASESNGNSLDKLSIPSTAKPSFFLLCAINDADIAGGSVVQFGSNASNILSVGTDANGNTSVEPHLMGGTASCNVVIPGTGWFYLVEFSSDTVSAPGGVKAFLDGVAGGGTITNYPTFTAQTGIFFGAHSAVPASLITVMGFTILKTVPTAAQVTEIRTKMSAAIPAHLPSTDPRIGRAVKFHEDFTSSLGAFYVSPKPSMNDSGQFGRFKFLDSAASEFSFQPVSIITGGSPPDYKVLQIQAKYLGSAMNSWSTDPKFQWLSALISTCDLDRSTGTINHIVGFDHAYFFARMKLPADNPYTWPAFWLLNKDGVPASPTHSMEIDANEQKGPEPTGYAGYYHQWVNSGGSTGTQGTAIHLSAFGTPTSDAGPGDVDLTADYHDYGVLVTGTDITLYCDHMPVKDHSGTVIQYSLLDTGMAGRSDKLFLLIDLGGNEDDPSPPTPSAGETHEFLVDYVKVYV